MYEKSFNFLKEKKLEFENGLTIDELAKIEKIYEIKFPESLREFLMMGLPVSKGFYNWRNMEERNIEYIKQVIYQPIKYINDMPEEVYWCDDWGKEPEDEKYLKEEVIKRLSKAPKLLPIFSHRYMPMISENYPPIISVHGVDIIYYGKDIEDYFEVEFGNKDQSEIDFDKIKPIQFWTDIM
ncbi:MAG: hypothetical protein WCD89_24925 [Anaerocolumna sp.]